MTSVAADAVGPVLPAGPAPDVGPVLEVRNVTLSFGGLTAVDDVSFEVRRGEIVSLIGPNGAGKTSLFNAISGVYNPQRGEVLVEGRPTLLPVKASTVAGAVTAALATGVFAVAATDLEGFWRAGIVDLYVYDAPFSYRAAAGAAAARAVSRGPVVWATALAGAAAGVTGFASVWLGRRRTPRVVAAAGVARTFQNLRLFPSMTVSENVRVAAEARGGRLRPVSARAAGEDADAALDFVGLGGEGERPASELSYGSARRLEIARALASKPRLLLLDEPAAGMNVTEASGLAGLVRRIRDSGVTVVLIEHHMKLVMEVSDRIVVLHHGRKVAEGTPDVVRGDDRVIEAYLGKGRGGGG